MMRIAIASDHAGFEYKERLISDLKAAGHLVTDLGTNSLESCDYPDFALAVALAVKAGDADRGVVLCGSGIGASIAANKVPGIRAGNVSDIYSAHQAVEHDDMNVLVLGARTLGIEVVRELLFKFLDAQYSQDPRHEKRLAKVKEIEARFSRTES